MFPYKPRTASDHKERLREAKQWLQEHPRESQSTIAKIFNINPRTLGNSIRRKRQEQPSRSHGGHNRILSESQGQQIHRFIRSYLDHNQLPTRAIVFGVICKLRYAKGKASLSYRWFSIW